NVIPFMPNYLPEVGIHYICILLTISKNVMIILLNVSGYCYISPCPPPLICTNHAPGIFSASGREYGAGTITSSVPSITSVGLFMLDTLSQLPFQLLIA